MPNRPPARGRLVLDTHVWIWAVEGMTDRLDPKALTAIEQAARASTLAVSAISVWELAMLAPRCLARRRAPVAAPSARGRAAGWRDARRSRHG